MKFLCVAKIRFFFAAYASNDLEWHTRLLWTTEYSAVELEAVKYKSIVKYRV